jgi:hypothetical protein
MTTVRATINSSIMNELQMVNANRAMFRGRQIDFTTTFFDHLEIRAIREANGYVVNINELRGWPTSRVANDEGIMALFASNTKWKKLKFGIDTMNVDLTVVNGVASVSTGYSTEAKYSIDPETMAHLMYAVDLMDGGFAYETTGHFGSIREIRKHEATLMVSTGAVSNLRVKTRVGNLELWVPLLQAALCVPQRPVQNDHRSYETTGDVIAKLFTVALSAWGRR